jgi:RNA polymerase sigma-54 factor
MAMTQNQGLVLEQGFRFNQQMIESVKLMELPAVLLRERIEEELEKNPALEIAEKKPPAPLSMDGKIYRAERNVDAAFARNEKTDGVSQRSLHSQRSQRGGNGRDSDANRQFLEGALARGETLKEHLSRGLSLLKLSSAVIKAGELIIGNLNDDGFHTVPLNELFGCDLSCDASRNARAALNAIHALDPVGCACEDYHESLAVQARILHGTDSAPEEKLFPFLCEIEKGKTKQVAKITGLSEVEVRDLFETIKTFSPFPGRYFSSDYSRESSAAIGGETQTQYISPDISVTKKNGEIVVKINEEEIPALTLAPFFLDIKNDKGKKQADKQANRQADRQAARFVKSKMNDAKWFIGAISKRRETLLKVTNAIIHFQNNFFMAGPKYLSALTQSEVADLIGMDVSTVSRAVNGKYIETDWGIYPLNFFFGGAVVSVNSNEGSMSRTSVKEIIKEIINENKHIKSDNEIKNILEQRGIQIARRTVAKYRGELQKERV